MSSFNQHICTKCGAKKLFPRTKRLIHHVKCVKCGHVATLTFILGEK